MLDKYSGALLCRKSVLQPIHSNQSEIKSNYSLTAELFPTIQQKKIIQFIFFLLQLSIVHLIDLSRELIF